MSIWGNDAGNFVKFIAIIKKKKALEIPLSQLITGAKKEGADNVGTSMTTPKFVHNISKSNIVKCIKTGDCTSTETSK
ncbi:hypothetical protein BYT27DRAFT_7193180 [Phlegmacium glaucopus]|nr:hypothetical protein BYT27DRAFT_7193180 [Phlegmacium glaucopus]